MADAVRLLPHAQPIRLWHKDTDTQNVDVLVLPGGFSYGDYLRSGAIARFSPIMQAVAKHAASGRPLIGICNGFQVLVEAGLLPGALLHNTQRRFICTDVHVRVEQTHSILTQKTSVGRVLRLPIAHGEGRYFAPQDDLNRLEDQGQVILRYCSAAGELTEEGNPNGSTNHIAGICNTLFKFRMQLFFQNIIDLQRARVLTVVPARLGPESALIFSTMLFTSTLLVVEIC